MGEFNRNDNRKLDVLETYADIIYCIDLTTSMTPIINKVKETAKVLHKELQERMQKNYKRSISRLRIKVIGFRDAYVDGRLSFEISKFFNLPMENDQFQNFVNSLTAKGGGDVPENSLEALALAMKSDWCETLDPNIRLRHIIVMFTDAPAHKLEKSADGIDENYPKDMPQTYSELIDWWGLQKTQSGVMLKFNEFSKRLGIFAPEGVYPWDLDSFDSCKITDIKPNLGGNDISTEGLLKTLCETLR